MTNVFPFMDQDENEFARLLEILRQENPPLERVLEIGVFKGGTLARFAAALPYATVVGIDPRPEIKDWNPRAWGRLRIIHGVSQSHEDVSRALTLLGGNPDFVFIDGDHTYDNAKSDVLLARNLGAKVIAIHDVKSVGNNAIDCKRVWEEIKQTNIYPYAELFGTRDGAWGIGVLWTR